LDLDEVMDELIDAAIGWGEAIGGEDRGSNTSAGNSNATGDFVSFNSLQLRS